MIDSFSHELRTPLNNSSIFLKAVMNDPTISNKLKQTFIGPALSSLNLLNYLIDDIIDFSQYNAE